MADKSYGQYGCFKWTYLEQPQTARADLTKIDDLSAAVQKDVSYFKNDSAGEKTQIVNYTWEKSNEESPTIFRRHEIDDKPEDDKYKNTLELMATYKGFPNVVEQNKWEAEPSVPPEFKSTQQKRRTAVLSTMTKFAEEMNITFPGYKLY